MGNTATLDLEIRLKGDKAATKGLSNMARESGGLNKAFGTLAKVGIGAAVLGIGAIGAGMAKAMGEASEWENGMAQLNAVIKSTGGAAGLTAKEVAALSTKLSASNGLSKFTDDAVLSANNLLLTFTKIGKDVFPQASQAAVDMAQALGGEPADMAIKLGKALNDPIKGVTALTKVGVTFSEEQKKVIASMVSTGDVAGAQKLILAELATEFGGSASAAAGTFSGKMITLQEKMNDVFQGIGEKLMPVMTGFVDFLSKPETIAGIQAFAEGLITGIGEAAKVIGPIIGTVAENVGKFIGAVTSGDAGKVQAFWDGIGGPIGAIGGFLTTAAIQLGKFIGAVASGDGETVKTFFNDLFGKDSILAGVGGFFVNATAEMQKFFQGMGLGTAANSAAVKVHSEEWNELYARNGAAERTTGDFWTTFWINNQKGIDLFKQGWKETAEERERQLADLKTGWALAWVDFNKGLGLFGQAWSETEAERKKQFGDFAAGWAQFWLDVGQGIETFKQAWNALWGIVFPGATRFHEEVAKSGLAGVMGANEAEKAWGGFLTKVPVTVGTSFKQAGQNAGQGFADGITSKEGAAAAAGVSIGKRAKEGIDFGLRSKSPSLETFESGQWAGDGFILGMRSKLPEIDAAAAEMGTTIRAAFGRAMPPKSLFDLVHNAVQPGVEAAYAFFREYLGTAHSGLQALIGMMVADSKQGVADILAEWARLNGTSSNGVPTGPDGIPDYQQSPGGVGDPSGGGGYGGGRPPQMRAWGGSIRAGMPYWVGEHGPELIIPDMPGEVVPAGRSRNRNNFPVPTRGGYGGAFGGGEPTIINLVVDGKILAQVVSPHLEERRQSRNRSPVRGAV